MQCRAEHVVDVGRQHDRVAGDLAGDVQQESRLADPGFAEDQHDAHAVVRRIGEARQHLLVFRGPADERKRLGRPGRKGSHEARVGREQARILIQHLAFEIRHRGRELEAELVSQRLAQHVAPRSASAWRPTR